MFEIRPLREAVGDQTGGGTPARQVSSYWGGFIPWASVKDFADKGDSLIATAEHITHAGLQASASNLIPAGTPLVCTRIAVGRSAIATMPVAINQDVKALFPARGTSAAYLLRLLQYVQPRADGAAVGSTVKGIRIQDYLSLEVPMAPQHEQDCIAQVLDTLDTTIRQTEAIIAKLKQVKQGLLHDLLTRGIDANGELRPPQSEAPHLYKASPLGWIPLSWNAIHMHEAIHELGQGWSPDCATEAAGSDAWGVLKTTAISWDGYSDHENKALPLTLAPRPELEVLPHDILITRAGPKERVAVVAYVEQTRRRLMISDKMYRLRLRTSEAPGYFALALSSEYAQGAIKRTISGMADSQTNISQPIIRSLLVMRPPQDEQQEIALRVGALSARLDTEQRYAFATSRLKSGLMDDLLTGRVRVTPLLAQPAAT